MIPYKISFNANMTGGMAVFEIVQDFYFMFDILVSFNTGVVENGVLIMTRKEIAIIYFKMWFWLDVVASFPYQMTIEVKDYFNIWLEFNNGDSSQLSHITDILRIFKFMRFIRMVRLVRVLKLKNFLIKFEEYLMSETFNLIISFGKLLLLILFIAHWGACFWFYIGISEFEDTGQSWIVYTNIIDLPQAEQYITCLYFYITTMTTVNISLKLNKVGYGDIYPITPTEKIYTMCSMILACGVFSYVVGSIGKVISSTLDEEEEFKQKIMFVNKYLNRKNISKPLRIKVRRYLEYVLVNSFLIN